MCVCVCRFISVSSEKLRKYCTVVGGYDIHFDYSYSAELSGVCFFRGHNLLNINGGVE